MKQHNIHYTARCTAAIAALFMAVFFTACDTPMGLDPGAFSGTTTAPAVEAGKASVSFSINIDTARTVVPEILSEGLTYTLKGKKGETESQLAVFSESGTTLALEPGDWTFTLYARNANEAIVLTSNGVTKTIAADQSNVVSFILMPLREGTGAVNISFNYPAQAGISRVTIDSEYDKMDGTDNTLDGRYGIWSYEWANIDAGDYFTTFTFYRGAEVVTVVSELIQVRKMLTSKETIHLTIGDIKGVVEAKGTDLTAKLQWIADNATNETNYLVEVTDGETIDPQILDYDGKFVSITLIGIGEERIISLSAAGTMFTVESGVTLALENNITLAGMADNPASLVKVDGGTLVLNDGAKISGNISKGGSYSGTVSVGNGYFTMNGGEISGNDSYDGGVLVNTGGRFLMNGGKIIGNNFHYYGSVNVNNGAFTMWDGEISGNVGLGVDMREGNFTMSGGKISRNTRGGVSLHLNSTFEMYDGEISGNDGDLGGGILVVESTFEMFGGKISGNTANQGGGVNANNGANFTMLGGEISGNTANSSGGGVEIYGSFTMNTGKISGNIASQGGGGVNVNDNSTFTMNGGEISGNHSPLYGGGVHVFSDTIRNGSFTMTGGRISGNTASQGGGVYVDERGDFSKTTGRNGVIYGNERGAPLANSANRGGHAVYWAPVPHYRNSTLGEDDSISTKDAGTGWEHPEAKPIVSGWNSGNFESGFEQWHIFTPSAATQYIHVKLGALTYLNVEVYDGVTWEPVGSRALLSGSSTYESFSNLSTSQTYHIKLWPNSGSGDYQLAVNDTAMPPANP